MGQINSYTEKTTPTETDEFLLQETGAGTVKKITHANLIKTALTKYTTVVAAEAASGADNDLCYVVETETFYRYESAGSAYTDDNTYILSTGDGGNTRWLAIAGKYNIKHAGADYNTFEGYNALVSITPGSGTYNSAFGYEALTAVSTGDFNVGIGYLSGKRISTGLENIILGYASGQYITTESNNTIIGSRAGLQAGMANCTLIGALAGAYNSATGATFIGYSAGYNSTGAGSTLIGFQAGDTLTTGSNITIIGYDADSFSNNDTDSIIIGANVTGTADQQIRIGNSNITTTFIEGIYGVTDGSDPFVRISSSGQLRQDSSSLRDKEIIKDLQIDSSLIYLLKPKLYKRKSTGKNEIGYIAEEMFEVFPEAVGMIEEKKVVKDSESNELVANHINYEKIIIPLVEEIKKLKIEIDFLKSKLEEIVC